MIKAYSRRKLSRASSHRTAMLRNLATDLFMHEKIKTTFARAKELQRFSERLITKAKGNNLTARRAVDRDIKDKAVLKKIFEVLLPRYSDRKGGYTQVYKIGQRMGDSALMSLIRLVQ
ncbi:MAG: 50S ribosomal protein L17 [Elusimicrobia bacterium CG_4_10_14_0_8_um_filter_37_32]|nr:MAG: 50S ribosomal protein L17 [Elusimicrobia bacterium CG02_land_8_20_14_3_00_37_13]PIZ13270.1 MAG: 50S ribosomal protein L17 [Elusimicrobia bacterium CG_4_10_14_0_8_um_filter_37_32]